jgi:DNA-binding transcriptional LysR family regulator
LTRKKKIQVKDMAAYDWILPGEGNPRRRAVELLFADQDVDPRIRVETSSITAHKAILASSDRITLLTESEIKDWPGQLAALPFDGLAPRRPEGYAIRTDWRPTLIQQHFLQMLKRHAQAWVETAPDRASARGAENIILS